MRKYKEIFSRFKGFSRECRGSVSVEMAIIGAAVFFAALPLADFASRIHSSLQLSSAVRTATNYAIMHPTDTAGIEDVVENNAGSMDDDAIDVTTSTFCECGGSEYACNNSCAYGMQTFLTVSATYEQPLLVQYPVYGQSLALTRSLTVRIE